MGAGGSSLEVRELLWASLAAPLPLPSPNPGAKELHKINGEISGALEQLFGLVTGSFSS